MEITPIAANPPTFSSPDAKELQTISRKLESVFLSEMLKHAKYGETPDSFGGGVGEDQFSSFLRQAQADAIVDAGGIGLAQSIFEALAAASGAEE